MSYLLVADFQNFGHEETTHHDKASAIKAFEDVKKHNGAQSAFLYKLDCKKSWLKGQ